GGTASRITLGARASGADRFAATAAAPAGYGTTSVHASSSMRVTMPLTSSPTTTALVTGGAASAAGNGSPTQRSADDGSTPSVHGAAGDCAAQAPTAGPPATSLRSSASCRASTAGRTRAVSWSQRARTPVPSPSTADWSPSPFAVSAGNAGRVASTTAGAPKSAVAAAAG